MSNTKRRLGLGLMYHLRLKERKRVSGDSGGGRGEGKLRESDWDGRQVLFSEVCRADVSPAFSSGKGVLFLVWEKETPFTNGNLDFLYKWNFLYKPPPPVFRALLASAGSQWPLA